MIAAGSRMTPDRWQRVKHLFQDALEHPADERRAFVTEACGQDLEAAKTDCGGNAAETTAAPEG